MRNGEQLAQILDGGEDGPLVFAEQFHCESFDHARDLLRKEPAFRALHVVSRAPYSTDTMCGGQIILRQKLETHLDRIPGQAR